MQRRDLLAGLLAAGTAFAAMQPARSAAPEGVTILSADASGKLTPATVPLNPRHLAVADFAVLDTLDAWGLGERVVGVPKAQRLPYLAKYFSSDGPADIGSLRELDLERLMALEPDAIFVSARLRKRIPELSRIAPVVCLPVDWAGGILPSFERITETLGRIFGKEPQAQAAIASARARAARIREAAAGGTALVGLVTSAHVNLLGDKARCSLIGNELGFRNVAEGANATHGSESSFELMVKLDPDYLFVLDRDSAIGRKGASLARDVLDNELVRRMRAWRENHVVFLTAEAWYLAEGGVKAMDIMLDDVARALGVQA